MSALGRVVRAGVGRRRVQTAVMILTTLVAVTASVLAAGLLAASAAPFDHAFARQHGAHLTAQFDGTKVTAAQLADTAHVAGVTAAAGPYRTVSIRPRTVQGSMLPAGIDLPPLTIAGRASPGGPVDHVTLVRGKWATRAGQIVLDTSQDEASQFRVGDRIQVPSAPGRPTLTVVGIAQSVSRTAGAWTTPAQAAALTAPHTAPTYQMLYRFAHAATSAQIAADRTAIAAAVPPGALTGTQSYLAVKQVNDATTAVFVPFVAAFGILGLALSVLIISIVVSGAVGAARRRIGILKAVGFTPAQVARAYVVQALILAAIGAGLGVVLGNLLAVPVLNKAERSYGTVGASIPVWIDVAVPAALLAAVAGAAMVPALHAGRLRAVDAITVGRRTESARGRLVHRLASGLPLPRPLSLGAASPFARPARSASTAVAVILGAVAITLAVGLSLSLTAIQRGLELDSAGAVVVGTGGGQSGNGTVRVPKGNAPTAPADPAAVADAIASQPGTSSFYGTTSAELTVSGITGATTVIGYYGDSSWATHQMVSGHWLTGPGQAVVTGRFLTAAGVKVGDTLTLTEGGRSTEVRIVGEVFALSDEGMNVLTGTSTLTRLGLDAQPNEFHVQLKAGTSRSAYVDTLNAKLQPLGGAAWPNVSERDDVIVAMDALIAMLTVMLVVVAALGVLNIVVLDTRERAHDLGVFKALGMTPRQTIAMVITSVAGIGLLGGAIGVPLGIALHHYVLPIMAQVTGEHLPAEDIAVYHPPAVALLLFGGLLIAVAGALLPAGWAGASRTTTALRTE
jgi:putative ABC transport system permease protein